MFDVKRYSRQAQPLEALKEAISCMPVIFLDGELWYVLLQNWGLWISDLKFTIVTNYVFLLQNRALRISDLKFTVANYECRRTECAIAFECIDIRIARSCCGLVELLIISYKSLLCCGCLFLVICCNWIWYRFGRDSFSTACDIIYKKVNDVHSWPLFKFAAFDTPR